MVGRLFASFFGAVFIAGAFAYYNWKFSQFRFIDFDKFVLYEKRDIFYPKSEKYLFIIYNSKDYISLEKLKKLHIETPIILLDYYQQIINQDFGQDFNITEVKTGTDTFLQIVQRFNIYQLPTLFYIKREKGNLYKQDSDIYTIEKFQ
ncbi:MAG TPA: hypothetical protein EYO61_05470 [Campylobacterales bacterium]|nr:hypothetical protein [Campylobacterales bacterium]